VSAEGAAPSPAPATYRLQLRPEFGFAAVVEVADYLAQLGVTHAYSSPYLQAARGSTHGYDVIDHHRVNEALGGEDGHRRMGAALAAAGLGQLLDIVPNHMAVQAGNRWWWDVLENGPSSLYASYFDVDWEPPDERLHNRVLLPILADRYGRTLDEGKIAVARDGGAFAVLYADERFPVAPRSLDEVLRRAAEIAGSDDLAALADAFEALPPASATDRESVDRRHRDKEALRRWLQRLLVDDPRLAVAVDEVVATLNGDALQLDAFLQRQNYRLAFWGTARRALDYRRFFDITELAGLRTEDPGVFADTHRLVLEWLGDGTLDGVRVDHVDGLRDPAGYLHRLRARAPHAWIVVEKILEAGERLPPSWPADGTTGYDFTNLVGGLFVDPDGEDALTELYASFTGSPSGWDDVVRESKELVVRDVLASELARLTTLFVDVAGNHRPTRDFTRWELGEVLAEVLMAFPVYRTYVSDGREASEDDRRYVRAAIETAAANRGDLDPDLLAFLQRVLTLDVDGAGTAEVELALRFQQASGPVMAKGVEDTAFYRYNRMIALNEVGGDAGRFGVSVDEFHAANEERLRRWPSALLATTTHDTKRSEDVRARLWLLSEDPAGWAAAVQRWPHGIDRNTEYLLYQTLVGAHPLDVDRAVAYMTKASKEAKVHTSWVEPNADYDEALAAFVKEVICDERFEAELDAFVAPLVTPGRVNALAQQLLKLTSPGVPDVYQGTELWDLSLVDPDNRRPVDYAFRRRLLAEAASMDAAAAWATRADNGLPKMLLTHRALQLRRLLPDTFGPDSTYEPLEVRGDRAVAFARRGHRGATVTVVPRLVLRPTHTEVQLPPGEWRSAFTGARSNGGRVPVGELLSEFPVALLSHEGPL
jgi:(1->4)-alpha-D-glucan 1-alpha-D-glucosylmutase